MSDTSNLIIALCQHRETGLLTAEEFAVLKHSLIKELIGKTNKLPKAGTSSISQGDVTYSLAPADCSFSLPHFPYPKAMGEARYILRSSGESVPSPIYFRLRGGYNTFATATHLKTVDGLPVYEDQWGECHPIDWDSQGQKVWGQGLAQASK